MNTVREPGGQETAARIADHPLFKGISPEHLSVLSEGAREKVFEPGTIILSAGQPAYHLYLIEDGKIAIQTPAAASADAPLKTLGAGEVLGWSWLFAPYTWHLQARALERTRTVCLDGGHLVARCEADHRLGYELMKRISQIVISRLQSARNELLARKARAGGGTR